MAHDSGATGWNGPKSCMVRVSFLLISSLGRDFITSGRGATNMRKIVALGKNGDARGAYAAALEKAVAADGGLRESIQLRLDALGAAK